MIRIPIILGQPASEAFTTPFGMEMNPDNHRVQLVRLTAWEALSDIYAKKAGG
ncbi:MAG: hypothetical protein WCJ01_05195 [Ignavibacteria bacterium]